MPIIRSDQALIFVEFVGVTSTKTPWAMLDGGDMVAESTQAFPGGSKPLVALGGFAKPSPLTVERPWEESLIVLYKTLFSKVGALEASISYQASRNAGEGYGPVTTYTGVLSSVTRPNYKAGTSEEAKLKCIFDINGEIA